MNSEVIKSFLVGLGFGVDNASLTKFNQAILSATKRVTVLYASIKALAAGIFWSMSKISEGFEQMGYEYRIIAPAINKTLMLRNELLKAYRTAGVDIVRTIQQSIKFNMALTKLQFAFKAMAAGVASKFFPLLTKQMDIFRKQIYGNMPKIIASLTKFITFIFKAFEATVILGQRIWSILQRVYDFFAKLHEATNGWSTIIGAVIIAWKALNLAFLATPLGMIITGILALIALYDDFMVWKEGGQALIDWGSQTTKMIVGITTAIAGLAAVYGSVVLAIKLWTGAQWLLNIALTANPIGLIIAGVTALIALITTLAIKMGYLKGVGSFFTGLGENVLNFFGNSQDAAKNVENMQNGGNRNALGAQAAASNVSNTNQNVQQQTNIQVMGSADASSTAQSVASQQGRVNFDMVRNMKGAAR